MLVSCLDISVHSANDITLIVLLDLLDDRLRNAQLDHYFADSAKTRLIDRYRLISFSIIAIKKIVKL